VADWKNDLANLFESKDKDAALGDPKQQQAAKVKAFFTTVIVPAFEELKAELTKHGRQLQIQSGKPDVASLTIMSRQGCELDCRVEMQVKPNGTILPVYRERSLEAGGRYFSEEALAGGMNTTKEQFLQQLVLRYKGRLNAKA
jgi:hypothetical protein